MNLKFLMASVMGLTLFLSAAHADESRDYNDIHLDMKVGATFFPNFSAVAQKFAMGPNLGADYGIHKYFRAGAETSMPLLISPSSSGVRFEGLPWLASLYAMASFPTEVGAHTLVPYFKIPAGMWLAMGNIGFLTGLHSGMRWFFSDHWGVSAEAETMIIVARPINVRLTGALGAVVRF